MSGMHPLGQTAADILTILLCCCKAQPDPPQGLQRPGYIMQLMSQFCSLPVRTGADEMKACSIVAGIVAPALDALVEVLRLQTLRPSGLHHTQLDCHRLRQLLLGYALLCLEASYASGHQTGSALAPAIATVSSLASAVPLLGYLCRWTATKPNLPDHAGTSPAMPPCRCCRLWTRCASARSSAIYAMTLAYSSKR